MLRGLTATVMSIAICSAAAADVFTNAEIAHQRMRELCIALNHYMYDNREQLPASPADLYPVFVTDPLVFWHPGDSDPAPTTIDNDVLNAPNSAAISFEWVDFGQPAYGDMIILRDSSADNNGGQFISMITANGVIETDPPLATPTPTADELIRAHLQHLYHALTIYANIDGHYPDDLIRLWELGFVRSPRTFWHPGDSDPMPTDITNSVLNAPNSTQISFEFLAAGRDCGSIGFDEVILRDNTADNNQGQFIYVVTHDGIWTDPPQPVNYTIGEAMDVAASRLRNIGRAMYIYANHNYDSFPEDLIRLWEVGLHGPPRGYWNPGDCDPMPTDITNSVLDAPNSAQISFEYLGAGLTASDPPDTTVLRDISPDNNAGLGQFVVKLDGRVELELAVARGDGNADGQIDLADWQLMLECMTGPDPYFRMRHDGFWTVFNFNGDDSIDLADMAGFLAAYSP